jgi:hypothetical protein
MRDAGGRSAARAWLCAAIAAACIGYGTLVSFLQIFPSTACLSAIGGQGCGGGDG